MSANFSVTKGTLKRAYSRNDTADFVATSPNVAAGVPTIGFAAHEALIMQDVAAAGWARFENLDTTNYVEIGTDVAAAFVPFLKISPGEYQFVKLATNAPYAKANTAAVKLDYEIFQA